MPPKKKILKKSSARASRKEPYDAERARQVVEQLRELSARLAGLARGMADAKVSAVEVDGHAMLLRGLNQIENFVDNLSRAVREQKIRRS
jgi:hypothetical protein